MCLAFTSAKTSFLGKRVRRICMSDLMGVGYAIAVRIPSGDRHLTIAQDCVCRVCVVYEFYAFYAFHAIIESVSYRNMEGLKVQVPPPASHPKYLPRSLPDAS